MEKTKRKRIYQVVTEVTHVVATAERIGGLEFCVEPISGITIQCSCFEERMKIDEEMEKKERERKKGECKKPEIQKPYKMNVIKYNIGKV